MSRLRALAARLAPGVAVAALIGAAGAAATMGFGLYDVRASSQHTPLVAWAVHATMIRAAQIHAAGIVQPPSFTPAEVQSGFDLYDRDCATCHGGPATPRADWVNGMNPSPPFLMDSNRLWTNPQLFWIIKGGVKMTGMPAWGVTRSDGQIWDLVAFLDAMPNLPPGAYAQMRAQRLSPAGPHAAQSR